MSYSDIVRPFIFNMNGDYAEPQTKSIETKASVTNTKNIPLDPLELLNTDQIGAV